VRLLCAVRSANVVVKRFPQEVTSYKIRIRIPPLKAKNRNDDALPIRQRDA